MYVRDMDRLTPNDVTHPFDVSSQEEAEDDEDGA